MTAMQQASKLLCNHKWVVDTTSTRPNDEEGYVYCEKCDTPKTEVAHGESAVRPFCVGCGANVQPVTMGYDQRTYELLLWWPGCPVCGDRGLCLRCLYVGLGMESGGGSLSVGIETMSGEAQDKLNALSNHAVTLNEQFG